MLGHLKLGEVVHLPLGKTLRSTKTTTLVKTTNLEVIRLVVPSGKEIPTQKAPGPITVQCLEGRALITAYRRSQELRPGNFLHLSAAEPYSVAGIENSSLLVTILLPRKEPDHRLDAVQEASGEWCPASDSPAH